jgi:hypothetical protein
MVVMALILFVRKNKVMASVKILMTMRKLKIMQKSNPLSDICYLFVRVGKGVYEAISASTGTRQRSG